ncbi:serine/threonine-protein kinase [Algoriphagus formosus]|uniref:serine/threonine-protein kinase n=1 Tax=Algoriphagus formosus TaxID=2007308 RepID=UPI000C28E3F2|nr:serine/threonine-protein kinase [Algoriphagus formosus]
MKRGDGKWEEVSGLFHELTELSETDRKARLQEIAEKNPALYDQLTDLLEADLESHPIFKAGTGSVFSILENDHELINESIGPFQLKELVGQGAMGTVFKGIRVDGQFDQVVAIKLMKPLMINPAYRSFFDRERQILAKLNHPNIARLYDGGFTEDERPFFTMEWVSGNNLLDYCRIHNHGLIERLKLFGQVCQAVQYAHQSMIAHLDIKPQNIIVNQDGQVKLLDFGVSQMLEEGNEQEGSFTLAYASPEQIERDHPNTVSDIYSLGVVLFELLCGYHPFKKYFEDPTALKEAVLEGNRASFRLLLEFGSVAFADDLSLICIKAMEKYPDDRYASVDELVRDLENFEQTYPILAHPEDWTYRAKKYIRRNRTILAVVNSAALLLVALGLFYTFQLREQRNIALAEAKRANQITNLITDVFSSADPNIGGADTITAVQLLDEGLKNLEKNLGDDPALFADMLLRLGPVYLSLGQYDKAKNSIDEAYQINLSQEGTSVEILARNEVLKSSSHFMFGKLDSAVLFSEKAIQRLTDAGINEGELLASALLELGTVCYDITDYSRADSALTAGLRLSRLADPTPNVELATLLHMKGATARKLDRFDSAKKYLTESLEMKRQLFDEPHLEIAYAYNYFGSFYQDMDDYEQALDYVKKSLEQREAILGMYHVETVASMGNLARTYIGLGNPEEAIPVYQSTIVVIDSIFGRSHYYYGALHGSLGNAYYAAGDLKNAREVYETSLEIFDELLSDKDPRKASPRQRLGKIAMDEGRFQDARLYYAESLEIREKLLPQGDIQIAQSQQALGGCLLAMGDFSTAIEYLEKALETANQNPDENQNLINQLNSSLAEAFDISGNPEKASFYASSIEQGN